MHIKCRVLDLLSVFLSKQSSNPLVLNIMIPLLSLIDKTRDKKMLNLVHKAESIINQLVKTKELPFFEDTKIVADIMSEIFDYSKKIKDKRINRITSEVIMYLVKVYRHANIEKPYPMGNLIDTIKEKLTEIFKLYFKTRRGTYDIEFFYPFFKSPLLGWELIDMLVEIQSKSRNPFQLAKIFELYQMVSATFHELPDVDLAYSKLPLMVGSFQKFCEKTDIKAKHVRPALQAMNHIFNLFIKNDEQKTRPLISSVQVFLPPLCARPVISTSVPVRNIFKQTMEIVSGQPYDPPPITKKRKIEKTMTKKKMKKLLKKGLSIENPPKKVKRNKEKYNKNKKKSTENRRLLTTESNQPPKNIDIRFKLLAHLI